MPDHVPDAVKQERIERLVDVTQRIAAERNAERVGRIEDVLVEGPSRVDAGLLRGRTRRNTTVNFTGDARCRFERPCRSDRVDVDHLAGSPARARRRVGVGPLVVAIFGPTASGKTEVAAEVARRIPADLISADSMQVYDGLPILTAQPRVATRLVAIWPLEHEASVADYQQLAHAAIDDALAAAKIPVVVGGSGLYLRAALADLTLAPPPAVGVRERWERLYDRLGPARAHALLTERDPGPPPAPTQTTGDESSARSRCLTPKRRAPATTSGARPTGTRLCSSGSTCHATSSIDGSQREHARCSTRVSSVRSARRSEGSSRPPPAR